MSDNDKYVTQLTNANYRPLPPRIQPHHVAQVTSTALAASYQAGKGLDS
jgi:hypothetical protein